MKILDGTLRWIITPHKGKVYFLSPISRRPSLKKKTSKILSLHEKKEIVGPKTSVNGNCGYFVKSKYWEFFLNGRKVLSGILNLKSWHFGPKSEIAYLCEKNGQKQFFVNGVKTNPSNLEKIGSCAIDKRGRVIMQGFLNGKEVLALDNKIVSDKNATEIGAWQINHKGEPVLAQKISGKWGVYSNSKKISPECEMVWGWQYTYDGKFIIPVEMKKGDNLLLLRNGKKIYNGKGNLLTWHHEKNLTWILAIENDKYVFIREGKIVAQTPANKGAIVKWELNGGSVKFKQEKIISTETPRTCHPIDDYVTSNEWWFH